MRGPVEASVAAGSEGCISRGSCRAPLRRCSYLEDGMTKLVDQPSDDGAQDGDPHPNRYPREERWTARARWHGQEVVFQLGKRRSADANDMCPRCNGDRSVGASMLAARRYPRPGRLITAGLSAVSGSQCGPLAEAVGFEPTEGSPLRRFSRPVPSTARPHFREKLSPIHCIDALPSESPINARRDLLPTFTFPRRYRSRAAS